MVRAMSIAHKSANNIPARLLFSLYLNGMHKIEIPKMAGPNHTVKNRNSVHSFLLPVKYNMEATIHKAIQYPRETVTSIRLQSFTFFSSFIFFM